MDTFHEMSSEHRSRFRIRFRSIILFLIALIVGIVLVAPPRSFPRDSFVSVKEGDTPSALAERLASEGYIRHPDLFLIAFELYEGEKHLSIGDYYFPRPENTVKVAERLAHEDFGITQIRVTIPEGFAVRDIGALLEEKLPLFDDAVYDTLTKGKEGMLFPETYFFFPSTTTEEAVGRLLSAYSEVISSFSNDIAESGRSESDILTMASIVEKEASGEDDRAMIAGILWSRIDRGMPLQVDAPFLYSIGKGSESLTLDDLAAPSPYNTYVNKGLPPTPIGNPGRSSIDATIHPEASPYLFYLHDKRGTIHYARTYDEHLHNIDTYLR